VERSTLPNSPPETETRFHIQPDGTLIVENIQDCEDIIERNKALNLIPQRSDWGRHVASIPNIVINKWLNEEAARGHRIRFLSREMDELVERKIKDPEWAWLRTDWASINRYKNGVTILGA
jgi:hypothetical protein